MSDLEMDSRKTADASGAANEGARATGRRYIPFLVVGFFALVLTHVVLVWTGPGEGVSLIQERALLDTDSYMWMNRVTHLAQSGDWFDRTYRRVNPPDGHEQHWTRPFDAVLLLGGLGLGALLGFADGLYFWAVALPPIFHLATLLALWWAVGPLIRSGLMARRALPILVLVFFAQLAIYQPFLVGRPDHHGLLALLFVLYLGFWYRVLMGDEASRRPAIGLGLVGALAVWVNVEALIFVALGMAGLGLSWLAGDRTMGRKGAAHALTLVGASMVAVLTEHGSRAFRVRDMDILSVPHLGLFAFCSAFWILLVWITDRGMAEGARWRVVVSGVAGASVLGLLALTFPEFYASPLAGVDQLYARTRLQLIDELQPLATSGSGFWANAGMIVSLGGAAVVCLPYLVVRFLRARGRDERVLWSVLGAFVALYLMLSLGQRRWTDYLALSSVVPFTLLTYDLVRLCETAAKRAWAVRISRLAVLAIFLLGPPVLGEALGALGSSNESPVVPEKGNSAFAWDRGAEGRVAVDDGGECDLVRLGQVLNDGRWFEDTRLVLAHTDRGPEILYRTNHHVLSIPNHRFQPGYHFTHRVMGHGDPSEATAMLHERGVGVLLLCLGDITSGFFHYPDVERSFAQWLAEGGVPEGYVLHAASTAFRVYVREE